MAQARAFKFKRTVSAPASEVYRAFTQSTALREWLCDAAQVDLHKGGRIHLWWNSGYHATGEFTALAPGRKAAFTWRGRGEPDETRVQVALAEKGTATTVTLTHAGVGSGAKWSKTVEQIARGWESGLENLQSTLETGLDLRFTLRPMLGIQVGEFNAGIARKLALPVNEGVRLDGVVDNMGAQAAGLRKDDVIVQIGGKKVTGWPTLTAALQGHRAGDEVKVVFYRGRDQRTTLMKLSRRPLPDVPMTAEGLAKAARRIYDDLDAQLAQAFAGVSEEAASREPAPGEWSAKDVVCHLIAGERDGQFWLGASIGDQVPWADDWGGNIRQRHTAILTGAPTVPDLLATLKRHEAETVAMMAALPASFVAHKCSFWWTAYNLLQAPDHNADHLRQIRTAIDSARR